MSLETELLKAPAHEMEMFFGTNVLVTKPQHDIIPGIELSEASKNAMEDKLAGKYMYLEVFAVGDAVTRCKKGDRVLVKARSLKAAIQSGDIVALDGEIHLMIQDYDLIGKYKAETVLTVEK